MAEEEEDQSLDSFFAKKDKGKKPKKKKKTKSSESNETQSGLGEMTKKKTQSDEWNDYEEEKEKDYSNLKMQDLQICEEVGNNEVEEEEEDGDEVDGEKQSNENKIWVAQNGAATDNPKESGPVVASTPNVVGGKYVPPSLKRSALGGQGPRKRPGVAPDIKSQAAFPTLGAANQELTAGKTPSDFETVTRGTRSNDARFDESSGRPRLNLDNRFNGLRS